MLGESELKPTTHDWEDPCTDSRDNWRPNRSITCHSDNLGAIALKISLVTGMGESC